jgi:hypothetical protein
VKFSGKRSELRPVLVNLPQVIKPERMLFDRNVVQTPVSRSGRRAPGLQGGKEIQPEPEARFEDDKALTADPARRQLVAGARKT